jgi:hypothetical protein
MTRLGQKTVVSCSFTVNDRDCQGWIKGRYGGEIVWENIRIRQHLNCTCTCCGVYRPEMFEYLQGQTVEISDRLVLKDAAWQTDFYFDGIGFPLLEAIDPYEFLLEAIDDQKRQCVMNGTMNSYPLQ